MQRQKVAQWLKATKDWFVRDPETQSDGLLNFIKRLGIIVVPLGAVITAVLYGLSLVGVGPSSSATGSPAKTKESAPSPEADEGSTTTLTGEGSRASGSSSTTSSTTPSENTDLEVLEVEYAEAPIQVPIDKESAGYPSVLAFDPEASTTSKTVLPLVVTFRNSTDRPLVLNNLRMTITTEESMPLCVQLGGEIGASYSYDFAYPLGKVPWTGTRKQNYEVEPNSTDALTVTLGPYYPTENVDLSAAAAVFSLSGESPDGDEIELAVGVHLDSSGSLDSQSLLDYTIAEVGEAELASSPAVADCVTKGLALVQRLREEGSVSSRGVEHPDLRVFEEYYRLLNDRLA